MNSLSSSLTLTWFSLTPAFPVNLQPPVTCDYGCHQLVNQQMRQVSPSEQTIPPAELWVSEIQLLLRAE